MNVVMNEAGGLIEIQGTAEGHAFQRGELDRLAGSRSVWHRGATCRTAIGTRQVTGRPRRWVLASGNRGKLREIQAVLAGSGIELVSQGDLGVEAPAETGLTFIENALLKARHASHITGLPAIADDSGLSVDALGGAPGIHSARYAGVDAIPARTFVSCWRHWKTLPTKNAARRSTAASSCCSGPMTRRRSSVRPPGAARSRERPAVKRASATTRSFFDPALGMTAAELERGHQEPREPSGAGACRPAKRRCATLRPVRRRRE